MVDLEEVKNKLDNQLKIEPGDSTEVRDITASSLGDDYISSYYDILAAAEKNTIHFADTQANLPTPNNYDELVGIAETVRNDSSQRTLHYYDGAQWIDTYDSEIIQDIKKNIDNIQTELDNVRSHLTTKIQENDSEISSLKNYVGYRSNYNNNLSTRIRDLEDDVNNIENEVHSELGNLRTERVEMSVENGGESSTTRTDTISLHNFDEDVYFWDSTCQFGHGGTGYASSSVEVLWATKDRVRIRVYVGWGTTTAVVRLWGK